MMGRQYTQVCDGRGEAGSVPEDPWPAVVLASGQRRELVVSRKNDRLLMIHRAFLINPARDL